MDTPHFKITHESKGQMFNLWLAASVCSMSWFGTKSYALCFRLWNHAVFFWVGFRDKKHEKGNSPINVL